MNRLFRLLALIAMLCAGAGAGEARAAEQRVALVLGNGAYANIPKLPNPPNDAKLVAAALRELGFDVIERTNARQDDMKQAVRQFGEKLEKAGAGAVALFFYAGHGVQVQGRNFLIPVNADIRRETEVEVEALDVAAVMNVMDYARARLNFVILDACRNNPFAGGFRSASGGLARMDAPSGTLISYATAPGSVAVDGTGSNSPFTAALVREMKKPGVPVEQMFKQVRIAVKAATEDRQTPWEASSLTGDFFFRAGEAGATAGINADTLYWQSMQASERAEDFESYLSRFPAGAFADLARSKLASLGRMGGFKIEATRIETVVIQPTSIRSAPNAGAASMGQLAAGEPIAAIGRVKGQPWLQVRAKGGEGYVFAPHLEWGWAEIIGAFDGEVTNGVRGQPDKVSTKFDLRGGRPVGSYSLKEPGGVLTGALDDFTALDEKRGVFRWKDRYGSGKLTVQFSDDLRSFTGVWEPDGVAGAGGRWTGRRP